MNEKEIFEIWPEAKAARENKIPWSYEPETAECGVTLFHEDDDNEGEWYTTTICQGFSYDPESDKFTCDEWRCWDGDWDVIDSYPLERMGEEYQATWADHLRGYGRYLEWVAEHGEDPCEEFYIRQNSQEQQEWEVTFRRTGDKTVHTNWRQLTGTPIEENVFPPDEVAHYMAHVNKTRTCSDGTVQEYSSSTWTWEEIIDAAQHTNRKQDVWTEKRTPHDWTYTVVADLWVKVPNKSHREQLQAAAREALRKLA